ncbi:MAG TPA: hypothetical protein VGC62_03950 [Pseudomonas sp.]|uniref:hypothetical protein n=1 Tax=Pseudomonas sp. TaxID=306 RepID=UPI002ED992E1
MTIHKALINALLPIRTITNLNNCYLPNATERQAEMNRRELDRNLLVIFNPLLVDRSVSMVAEGLGLTQQRAQAVAHHVQLRAVCRYPRGMQPTPYAAPLAQPVSQAIGMLHGTINRQDEFDPSTSEKRFVVAMTDIGETYCVPRGGIRRRPARFFRGCVMR